MNEKVPVHQTTPASSDSSIPVIMEEKNTNTSASRAQPRRYSLEMVRKARGFLTKDRFGLLALLSIFAVFLRLPGSAGCQSCIPTKIEGTNDISQRFIVTGLALSAFLAASCFALTRRNILSSRSITNFVLMGGALIFSKYHVLDFKHWRDSSAARQGLSIVLAFNTQLAVALVTSFLLGDISVNYARLFVGDYKYCIEFLGRKVYPSLLPIIPRRIEVGVFMLLTSPKLTGSGWVWQKVLRFGQVLGFFLHLFLDAVTGVALLWAVSHPLIAPGLMVHDSSWAQWGAWMRLIFRAMVQFFPLTVWQKQLGRRRRRLAKEKRKGPVSLPGTEAYVLV